jgi:predicted extracellular nuclease
MRDMLQSHGLAARVLVLALILTFALGGGLLAQAAGPGDVVINEIMQNPSAVSDADGEWFELYNPTPDGININGWTIQDNGSDSHVIDNGGPLVIPAGGYLVLGSNADTETNGGVSVDYSYNGNWFLANGDDEIVLRDETQNVIDFVEYDGGPNFPDPNGASMALSDPTLDNNDGANWCTSSTPYGDGDLGTPGAENDCPDIPDFGVCGDPATLIHVIQGNSGTSTEVGMYHIIEGVVVSNFQGPDQIGGYHVQEQDADVDSDPATSEGIHVLDNTNTPVEGEVVRVEGLVAENYGLTRLEGIVDFANCGSGVATPATVSLPVTSVDDFEAYEGMLVTFPQPLVISEYYNFDRFGEIVLTTDRQFQPTASFEPGSPEAAQLALDNSLNRITLDDGRGNQNPDPAIHPNGAIFDLSNLFRGGDTVQNVTGVMDYAFSLYRIQPTQGADYTNANPRTAQPDDVGGTLKVASFNVLNYFTTFDTIPGSYNGPYVCGPNSDLECRGANDANEFERQRDKIIAALAAIDADVVGLIEIENHPSNPVDAALQDLVDGLNDAMGAGTYEYVNTGPIGTDVIKVAFIYKPASVSLVGDYAVLDDPSFTDPVGYGEQKSRPALAQTFIDDSKGGVFTVVVNHLKSKGTPCDNPVDDDPEQGSCNLTRTLGAQALVDWLATDPTGSGDTDFLIIGDLNSYDKEDPIDALVAGGYTDLLFYFLGEDAYSYVFDGQLGYLDHALSSPGLDLIDEDEVTGATVWHINADEPDLIDYDMTYKQDAQDAIYAPDAYRSSDHDPVITGLDVCDEIPPEVSVTPDTLWAPNHKYGEVEVIVTDNFDPNPTLEIVSVSSNEPDNGLGDGNTEPDFEIVDSSTINLRAERSGTGEGRIYSIAYRATDFCGNVAEGTALVTVAHDQGQDKDEGQVPPGQDKDKGEDHDQGQGNDEDWVPPGQDQDQEGGDDQDQGQGNDEDWVPPGQAKDKDNNGKGPQE